MYCDLADLNSEADVELKFLHPLLTASPPHGLGYCGAEIRCKDRIPTHKIGKGAERKDYFPDFVAQLAGMPILVVEAKAPDRSADEGFREARLYAGELNATYPPGVNPCQWILASNGTETVCGPYDSSTPKYRLKHSEVLALSKEFANLIGDCAAQSRRPLAEKLRAYREVPAVKPTDRIGGESAGSISLPQNPIGSHLTVNYRSIFDPKSREERARIVKEAYVHSQDRENSALQIDALIRSALLEIAPPHLPRLNTNNPAGILDTLRKGRDLIGETMYLIGSKGCGKSTFVDHLREVRLPPEIENETVWVRLNINEAPTDRPRLETWLIDHITDELRRSNEDVAVLERRVLEKIFGQKIAELRQGELFQVEEGSREYRQVLSRKIEEWRSEPLQWMKALSRYLCDERNRLLIIVYDNCDKRVREVQLTVFEAAHWIRGEINCFVILPLRDVTFETYADSPPLDTMQTTFKFHILPPPFPEVLRKRITLVLNDSEKMAQPGKYIGLLNAPVEFGAADVRAYLEAIYRALFDHDKLISGLMFALAARDIRKAINMFTAFCMSPHLPTTQLLELKTTGGQYALERDMVIRALMRGNHRYFKEKVPVAEKDADVVKNIFQLSHKGLPDHFVRWSVLAWYESRRDVEGPSGAAGFHRWSDMQQDLVDSGHDPASVENECVFLIESGLIESEHQEPVLKSRNDLLRISPPGVVHLELANNATYIGGCAEDTKMRDRAVAANIARRLTALDVSKPVAEDAILTNAWSFLTYLEKMQQEFHKAIGTGHGPVEVPPVPISAVRTKAFSIAVQGHVSQLLWRDDEWASQEGSNAVGTVVHLFIDGALVEIDGGPTGLAPKASIEANKKLKGLRLGDRVNVVIERVNRTRGQATLLINGPVNA
ncbi:MAG TPA: S1 RNA-binding domain-containing protein [Pirellulales bacterium]|nr:S1 RNA-binding domain-containing protein [Pirellulales bacterium]